MSWLYANASDVLPEKSATIALVPPHAGQYNPVVSFRMHPPAPQNALMVSLLK